MPIKILRLAALLILLPCLLTVVNPLEGDHIQPGHADVQQEGDNVLQQEDSGHDASSQQQAEAAPQTAESRDGAADIPVEQAETIEQLQDQDIPGLDAGSLDQGTHHQQREEQYEQGEDHWQPDADGGSDNYQQSGQERQLDDRDSNQQGQYEEHVQAEEAYQPVREDSPDPLVPEDNPSDQASDQFAEQTWTDEQVEVIPQADTLDTNSWQEEDGGAPPHYSTEPPVGNPNILILYADDLGIGDIGCYGNTSMRTPNLDRMAAEGARMTHHLSAAASGTPSRAGFLTGRLPIRYGMAPKTTNDELTFLSSMTGLPPTETTFAKVLQENGYTTGLVGKWGLGINCERSGDMCHHPNNHGFDHFFGAPIGNLPSLGPDGGQAYFNVYPEVRAIIFITPLAVILAAFFLRKYISPTVLALLTISVLAYAAWSYFFYTRPQLWSSALMRNTEFVEQPINFDRMTERLVKEGSQFLKSRQEDGRPFLLVMSWLQVHSFLHATPHSEGSSPHGPYGDEVEDLDWGVGEMLRTLKVLGFEKNTLVYFTTDNGAHIEQIDHLSRRIGGHNGQFRGGKYQGGQDGGIRTPGLLLWPGVIPPRIEIDDPTSQLDVAPTLVDLVGGTLPSDRVYDGKSILRLWRGETKASPHRVLFHYCSGFLHTVRFLPDSGTDVYTVYFYWPNWLAGEDHCGQPACSCLHDYNQLDTPAIYNIVADPGLSSPLDSSSFEYEDIMNYVRNAVQDHKAGLVETDNEFSWYKRSWHITMQPCCNFPTCECSDPENALQEPSSKEL